MVKAPKTEGQVRLTAIQLKKNPKKEKSIFVSTITSSKEDNGAKKSLPSFTKKNSRGNNVVMPKNQLKELCKGIARINGLLVAHTRRQDLVVDVTTMRHDRRINRWGRGSRPANSQ